MRVAAGEFKGFELKIPKGVETRPTSEKVRDAIFNVLGAECWIRQCSTCTPVRERSLSRR